MPLNKALPSPSGESVDRAFRVQPWHGCCTPGLEEMGQISFVPLGVSDTPTQSSSAWRWQHLSATETGVGMGDLNWSVMVLLIREWLQWLKTQALGWSISGCQIKWNEGWWSGVCESWSQTGVNLESQGKAGPSASLCKAALGVCRALSTITCLCSSFLSRGSQSEKKRHQRWINELCWIRDMPANLENSAVATGLEKVSFHSNPKERQCQRVLKLPLSCTHLTH